MTENKIWRIEKPIAGIRIHSYPWEHKWFDPDIKDFIVFNLPVLIFLPKFNQHEPISIPHWN